MVVLKWSRPPRDVSQTKDERSPNAVSVIYLYNRNCTVQIPQLTCKGKNKSLFCLTLTSPQPSLWNQTDGTICPEKNKKLIKQKEATCQTNIYSRARRDPFQVSAKANYEIKKGKIKTKKSCPCLTLAAERLWPQFKEHVKMKLTVDKYIKGIWWYLYHVHVPMLLTPLMHRNTIHRQCCELLHTKQRTAKKNRKAPPPAGPL